jgi:hypothetical protein
MPDLEQKPVASVATGHERHCFVVMPFGRDSAEQKWFKGWYEVVIRPAIADAGYEPKLSAAEEQPGAINDEIRAHLAFDSMVVVDLGGAEPEDDPNPNVMYELGIRHALSLPLVLMAWKGQRLPFDVSNQRIIIEDRDLVDLETNKKRLTAFIKAAEQGNYYKPMEAVGRTATISAASQALGEDSLLRALTEEIRELKSTVHSSTQIRYSKKLKDHLPTIKKLIVAKVFRKELYPHFIECGGDPSAWARILRVQIDPASVESMKDWSEQDWKSFITQCWDNIKEEHLASKPGFVLDDEILQNVREMLPEQPWQQGIHLEIADKLQVKPAMASKYIAELIKRGYFRTQNGGDFIEG